MTTTEEAAAQAHAADAEYTAKLSRLIKSANADDVVELFRLSTVRAAAPGNNNNNNHNNHRPN